MPDHLTTPQVAEQTGLTFRQLDYLARAMHWTPGSGVRRVWSPTHVRRLTIARTLADACPSLGGGGVERGPLPDIATAVFLGPPPPVEGWVAYRDHRVLYAAALLHHLVIDGGAVVARLPKESHKS